MSSRDLQWRFYHETDSDIRAAGDAFSASPGMPFTAKIRKFTWHERPMRFSYYEPTTARQTK